MVHFQAAPGWIWGPALVVTLILTFGFISRRYERSADDGAVDITSDPEALMTAHAKLAALNHLPLEWSDAVEVALTHPSQRKRIDRLAAQAGFSQEQAAEIIRSVSVLDGDHYEVPAETAEEEKIFSSRAWTGVAFRRSWPIYVANAAIPVALAYASWRAEGSLMALLLGSVAALALTATAIFLLDKWQPFTRIKSLSRKLARRLVRQGVAVDGEGTMAVGLGPRSSPRIYDQNHYWDAGFLQLGPDQLTYAGEQTQFSLDRSQLLSIEWKSFLPPFCPNRIAVIRWADGDTNGTFYVGRLESPGIADLFSEKSELENRITAWFKGGAPNTAARLGLFGPPSFGEVTSEPAAKEYSLGMITGSVLLAGFLALSAAFLIDLPFTNEHSRLTAGWTAVGTAVAAHLLVLIPYRLITIRAEPESN